MQTKASLVHEWYQEGGPNLDVTVGATPKTGASEN